MPKITDAAYGDLTTLISSFKLIGHDPTEGAIEDQTKRLTVGDLANLLAVPGTMFNGKISVTVSANDLIVALKTRAGSDPSSTDMIVININGTLRTVNTATSITLADATNWFNAGGAEFATKEIDYFPYAVWDSNSSIVAIAPARIPYGRLVSDFNSTSTNERYLGNYANFTSTDDVVNIGRFAATLSAGAGYTWTSTSQSAPTNLNTIQHPCFETRVNNWVPAWTNLTVGDGTVTAKYQIEGKRIRWLVQFVWGSTTSASGLISHTLPMTQSAAYVQGNSTLGRADFVDSTAYVFGRVLMGGAGAAYRALNAASTYLVETNTSATVPFTFATADEIHGYADYWIAA